VFTGFSAWRHLLDSNKKQLANNLFASFSFMRQTGLEQRPRAFQSPSNSAKAAVLRSFPIACLLRSLLIFCRIKNR
jgi:hypothetical protein